MERNENGYSEFRFSNSGSPCKRNCTGGEMWEGSGNEGACSTHQLAMVYSPYQCWRMLYSPDEALKHGTLFEELYKPLEDCVNG